MWYKVILIKLATFLLFLTAQSEEEAVWSLQECIDHAIENNLDIHERRLESERRENLYQQSREDRYPTLSLSGGHDYNFGRSVDRFTNEFATEGVHSNNMRLSANVTLFEGFRKRNTIRQNQKAIEVSQKGNEEQKWEITKNVMESYMDILLNKELLNSRETQIELIENETEEMEKRVNAGDQTRGDLLELQAEKSRQEMELINAENNLEMAYLRLKQLLELSMEEPFSIEVPDFNPSIEEQPALPPSEEIYASAKEHHPGLQRIRLDKEVTAYEQDIARADYYPTVNLQAGIGTGFSGARQEITSRGNIVDEVTIGRTEDNREVFQPVYDQQTQTVPFTDQLDNNLNQSIGISVNVPIYNNRQAKYREQEAIINRKIAENQLKRLEKQLLNDIQIARTDARSAAQKYEAARRSVKAHEQSFENTRKRIEAGMATPYRYSEASVRLQEAESEMIRARYEFLFKSKIISLFMGEDIEL